MLPTQLGRFVLLERLGAGAMGEVWSAHDPELDRTVAIKRIRGTADAERRARLLREAQALAQLAHPNVVAVFESGVADDEVYIAMEHVDGPTLRGWLATGPTRTAVLAMFEQTGRGLAAAHARGLVHRDFKPDNVLIGADGRARVVDFGLARAGERADAPVPPTTVPSDPLLFAEITATGEVLGTPAYMAPEQFMGAEVDARTDQFAFCVALFEALYGTRPFVGPTRMALAHAVTTGTMVPAPADRDVPPRLHREIVRGLAVEPAARHADMDALLLALTRDPGRRRRRVAAAVAGLAIATPVWFATRPGDAIDPCAAGHAVIGEVWGAAAHGSLREALGARGHTTAAVESVTTALDRYAARWAAGHRQACEAARGDATDGASARLFDASTACLARRRSALAAVVEVLAAADDDVMSHADEVTSGLPAIEPCGDPAFVSALAPIDDPSLRRTIDGIVADIDRSRALQRAGAATRGRQVAIEAAERAAATGHGPTIAEALYVRGLGERTDGAVHDAATTLEEALYAARSAGADDLAVQAAVALVEVVGHRLRDDAGAGRWIREAEALIARPGIDPRRRWELLNNIGTVHAFHHRTTEAEQAYEAALDAMHAVTPDEPREGWIINNLGALALARDDLGRAQYLFTLATTRTVARVGPDHLAVSHDLNNLGTVAFRSGDFAMARAWIERADALRRTHLGDDHPLVLEGLGNLAGVYLGEGDPAPAVRLLRRLLAAWDAKPGAKHPNYASTQLNLALALGELKDYADALVVAEAAASALTDQLGGTHPTTLVARTHRGQMLHALGRTTEALAALDQTLRDAIAADVDPLQRSNVRFAWGVVRFADAAHRDVALAAVHQARREAGDAAYELEQIDAWLAEHAAGSMAGP